MRLIGLDLSLTGPGIAMIDDGRVVTIAVKVPAKLRDVPRLDWILDAVKTWADEGCLAVLEGPSYGSQAGQAGHHERAGLWWITYRMLAHRDIPTAVVPPSNLKGYATGKGNADKTAMCMAAVRRFEPLGVAVPDDDNAVDALWLAAMGAAALGTPVVDLPQKQTEHVGRVPWPTAFTTILEEARHARPAARPTPDGPGPSGRYRCPPR